MGARSPEDHRPDIPKRPTKKVSPSVSQVRNQVFNVTIPEDAMRNSQHLIDPDRGL